MNSTNETLLFDRFLIMYNLIVCFHLYYRHVCISLYTCANVICIKLLLTYLPHFTSEQEIPIIQMDMIES